MPLLTRQQEEEARAQGRAAAKESPSGPISDLDLQDRAGPGGGLYDAQTGAPINLDPAAAQQAVLAGTAAPEATARVNVVDPEGEHRAVLGSDLKNALTSGFRLESPREASMQAYLAQNAGLLGSAKVAGGKLASEALFGIPEMLYEHGASKEGKEEWEALKSEHPYASAAGSVAGFGANLLVGGPVFKAATTAGKLAEGAVLGGRAAEAIGAGRQLVAGAARMGAEGAALAAPGVITEAALGDPQAAAEHLAWGLGGGAALGAAGTAAKWGLKGLGHLASDALEHYGVDVHAENPLKELSETQAFRSLTYGTDKQAIKIADKAGGTKEVGRYVVDNNLFRTPNEKFGEYAERIGERKNAIGDQIGSLYKELDATGATGPSASDLAKRFDEEIIDPLRRKATRQAEVNRLENFRDNFLSASTKQSADRGAGAGEDVAKLVEFRDTPAKWKAANQELKDFVNAKIEAAQPKTSLYDLWEQRKDLASKIYQERRTVGNLTPVDQELDKFRRMLDDTIAEHSKGVLGPGRDFAKEIAPLNRDYKMLSTVEDIAERSKASEESRRNLSLSDMIAGHGTGVAMAIHSPMAALAGLGGAVGHKYVRENGNVLVARYANQLGTYWAHRAVGEGERAISKLPSVLERIASRAPSAELTAQNGFRMLLGNKAAKNDQDNLDAARAHLENLANDPTRAAHVQEIADTLSQGAPTIAKQYQAQEQKRLDYLLQALPPAPPPLPFGKPSKPSKQQVKDFDDKLQIALNPHVVLTHLEQGTLRPAHVQALRAVWPANYDSLVKGTQAWGLTKAAKRMPYRSVRAVSMLVGQPLDQASQNLASYQAAFSGPAPERPSPVSSGTPMKLPGAEMTSAQRIQSL